MWKSIYLVRFGPYSGFLHSECYGGASLVFDLIEEFRQRIVDKTILSIVNKNQVNVDDFEDNGDMMLMNDKEEDWVLLILRVSWVARLNLMEIKCLILTLLCIREG